ncbi:PilZ domain-containing protein [Caulobacter sp. KR2-114]|uniref:PilZ domain-containing protein n=1 Tax=Caulobacter sp. KR2-114 TaxID=3400912 RepID=UPI003C0831C7
MSASLYGRRSTDNPPPYVEKRGIRRNRVFLAGKLTNGHGLVMDCTIRDLSEVGAKVHVPSAIGLPDEVALLVMREGVVRLSRRMWSRSPLFGLEFLDAEDIQTTTKAQYMGLRRHWLEWVQKPSAV